MVALRVGLSLPPVVVAGQISLVRHGDSGQARREGLGNWRARGGLGDLGGQLVIVGAFRPRRRNSSIYSCLLFVC